ncbi:Uncharacterized protein PCOAH_00002970 [Plasmodium coatneyi]|uniref:ATP-dependent RNA helicase n=1 Tax=Plasmodium coatneyi TaxID=208452 RepID=A0A1B1DT11_9APIC|nr:Uncharacterized protein PCOAH_00002970 [Plasmodium coatneyi]ANQ05928.1 Uncharacterized protein PCOAH_00002970 [Plasmodium coatneyi]
MLSHLLLIAFILNPFVITSPLGGTRARGRCAPTFIRTHPFQIAKSQIQQLYRKKGTYVIRARGGHHEKESRKGTRRDKRRNGSSSDHREDTKPKRESTPISKDSVRKHDRRKHTYNTSSISNRRKKKYTKEEVKAEKEKQLKGKFRRKKNYQGILKKEKKQDRRINHTDGGEEVDRKTDLPNGRGGDSPNEGATREKRNRGGRRTNRGRRTLSQKEQKILDMFQNDLNESIERLNKKTRKYELCRQNENLKSGLQGNEILRKVLSVGRSGKRKEGRKPRGSLASEDSPQMNRGVCKYVDDISDDAGGEQIKHSGERTKKERNAQQKVQLHSSPYREARTQKGNTHSKGRKTALEETNMTKLSQRKGRNHPQEEDTDKDGETNERIHNDEVEGENLNQKRAVIKIGKSVDPFRRRIHIDYDSCSLSDEVRKRLAKFSSIIDLNANGGGKKRNTEGGTTEEATKETTKEETNCTTEEYRTFADLGICDNFLNVYLKYNGIEKPTEYQAKFIPLLILFMNNGYSDWRNCSGGNGKMGEAASLGGAYPPVERIIYVNKYNERSGKLIRTFFLHCPTGTGKTFIYVLPLFQHIMNVCFGVTPCLEEATKGGQPAYVGANSDVTSNGTSASCTESTSSYESTPQDGETFYVRKEINADVTSFFCSNVKQEEQHFITQNKRNVAAMMNTLIRMNPSGEVKQPNCNDHMVGKKTPPSDKHPKNDVLIVTYNKELAVQIYHLCKDLIESFFKSSKSKFFEFNDSLMWSHLPNVDPQRKTLLERLNVNFKKKKNFNVHLLIGGNNIKYQLKGLKRPKVHLTGEIAPEGEASVDPSQEPLPTVEEDLIEHVNIYVGTPGRLERLINERQIINLENISTIVFDEYDFFFNSFRGKGSEETKTDKKPHVENEFFSKILRSIYSTTKKGQPGKGPLPPWTSLTNVICCSATPAVYSYLTFTRHIITTNFLRHLHGGNESVGKGAIVQEVAPMGEAVPMEETVPVEETVHVEGEASSGGYSRRKSLPPGDRPPIDRKLEESMLNGLFNLKEFGKIPENLIHLNYTYDKRNREWSNSATINFLNVLFSNPLRKNVLVFCNTKKRVMDLWSLFRNRFDVDIQTIFAEKDKKRKKIFKAINYANFFKNDLVDYKNLKKYVNFMFLSTNLLYRGINCMGFTTIVNFDMPSDPTEYVHRCGRIGRINNKGIIINIFEKSFRRTYKRRIFSKLGIHPYDVDCYMNNLFTLGGDELQGDVGKEVWKEIDDVVEVESKFFVHIFYLPSPLLTTLLFSPMNCAFLFYGKPCSGKDTFINLLLRKRKQLQLFLFLFNHLVHKDDSNVRLREKIFFIQLIKYYYRIGRRKSNVSISFCHGGETERKVSFRFLVHLTKHLLHIWRNSGWDPGAGSKGAKNGRAKKQPPRGAPPKGSTRQLYPTRRRVPQRNPLRRTELPNQSIFPLICYLYEQKDEWMSYYRSYLRRNKIKTFNVSLDFIEKQLYRGHPPKVTSLNSSKVDQRELHLLLNRRYTVYGREKHDRGVYYPIVKRTTIKGGHNMLIRGAIHKEEKGTNMAKKPTWANQVKYWRTARRIAYAYCASLMQAKNQRSSNNPCGVKAEHVFILLNDTFHLPSMRKKYYLLCRRYHFNYAQIYLNALLKICLERNRHRKKFKPIADKTIVRNHFYHQKYAVRFREASQTRSPNLVTVVRGGRKWQKKVFSIQVDSSVPQKVCRVDAVLKDINFTTAHMHPPTRSRKDICAFTTTPNQLTDTLRLIYNHLDEFRNKTWRNQTKNVQEVKRDNLPNRLDMLNLMVNRIIHEKLKSLPNERKNECAKKLRVIKLRLLKECRDGRDYSMKDLDDMFHVE